jgi:predicted enzyme related to lactoylglutathione lyase
MLKDITLVGVYVGSVSDLIPFYRDVLGLNVVWQDDEGDFAQFATGGSPLALHSAKEAQRVGLVGTRSDGSPTIRIGVYFLVEDMEEAVKYLKQKGVEFTSSILEFPFGKLSTFKDPTGTELHLYQRYPEG